MKTYGKAPESLSSITSAMLNDLVDFPAEKIMRAFKTHAQRSDEFPTTSNIIGLIKRNGKAPLSKEMFIAISKKDGGDRSPADWQYLREYQREQESEWEDCGEEKQDTHRIENNRLRNEIIALKQEITRLSELLHEERMCKGIETPKPTMQEKIDKTIDAMRQMGAPEEDIEVFKIQSLAA